MRSTMLGACLLAGGMLWMVGCGGGGGSTTDLHTAANTPGVGSPGSVRLLLADAPLDGVTAVKVEITRIDLVFDGVDDSKELEDVDDAEDIGDVEEEEGTQARTRDMDEEGDDIPITIFTGRQVINLLDLANQPLQGLLLFATEPVPSGHYKGMVLYLGSQNTVELAANPQPQPLKVPSNKLRIPLDLYVSAGQLEELVLDFNLAAPGSFHWNQGQGYMLQPVLRLMQTDQTGSVHGVLQLPAGVEVEDLSLALALLTTQGQPVLDDEGNAIVTRVEFEDGQARFAFHGIPAGAYTIRGNVTLGEQTLTFEIPNVNVLTGQDSSASTFTLPG